MAKKRKLVHVFFSFEGTDIDTMPDEWNVSCQAYEDIAGEPPYRPCSCVVDVSAIDKSALATAILAAVNAELGTE